jgi:hypothetical protein
MMESEQKHLGRGGGRERDRERTDTCIGWFIANLQYKRHQESMLKGIKYFFVSIADWPCWYRRISMWKERGETHIHVILHRISMNDIPKNGIPNLNEIRIPKKFSVCS